MHSNDIQVFFELVRGGLWEKDVQLSQYKTIDYSEVYQLAEEQSVVGLIAAGLEHVVDVKVPQIDFLTFIGRSVQIEQQNSAMNDFIGVLVDKMRKAGIYTLLVKGQGIAQCYERPLWRTCGDVDLLLSDDNYQKAKSFLCPVATSIEEENTKVLHLGMTIDQWIVEIHGSLRSRCLNKMDHVIDDVQENIFFGGAVRSWMNSDTQVFLPSSDNDVFLIFTHIIKHFFRGGIGLRQICDWCRLLWTFRESINKKLLEKRLRSAGLLTEWRTFAAYAVDYLGMSVEAIPLYSNHKSWSRKARRINSFILDVGNFGHNRDQSYLSNKPYLTQKIISLWRHTNDGLRHLFIFPLDSLRVWGNIFLNGLIIVFRGK